MTKPLLFVTVAWESYRANRVHVGGKQSRLLRDRRTVVIAITGTDVRGVAALLPQRTVDSSLSDWPPLVGSAHAVSRIADKLKQRDILDGTKMLDIGGNIF
jgi:hypothetical protein